MKSKLIVALDYDNQAEAQAFVEQINSQQCALKVGSEMFTRLGPDFVKSLVASGFKVFLDLKFHDIPNTVSKACVAAADLGVWMLNVHASGGFAMMQAARNALDVYGSDRPLLIAVTVLTSMTEKELSPTGVNTSLQEHVGQLASLAQLANLDGVVSSALEAPMIKAICGENFLAITPGIRMLDDNSYDQARIVTPEMAFKAGSDYIVVGRPITRSKSPADAIQQWLAYN